MAGAAVPLVIAGGAMSAIGALKQGQAAEAAGSYNAQMDEQNAVAAQVQAGEDARRQRIMSRKQLGDMRANYGASGVTLEGSPLDVMENSAANAELDALTTIHAGEVKAQSFRNQAALERFGGSTAKTSSYFSAAGSLLGAGGTAYGMKRT